MKELNASLKSGKLDSVYVFYGHETFLTRLYEKRLIQAVLGANDAGLSVFEGKSADVGDIIETSETAPFFSERRLIIVRDSGLLQSGRGRDAEQMEVYLSKIPEYTVILFCETVNAPDKRLKIYKTASAIGRAVEFFTPADNELVDWLRRTLTGLGKNMSSGTAAYMLKRVGNDMTLLYTEAAKLADYSKGEAGVSNGDIDAVCVKSLEARIFDLVKAIGQKDMSALNLFADLISLKEPPIMTLNMIARQFRMILLCSSLRKRGLSPKEIADISGLRGFMVSDCLKQAANFSEETLARAVCDCHQTDTDIKSGKMADRLAVEMLIIKYCG